jgi:hypothetical protein
LVNGDGLVIENFGEGESVRELIFREKSSESIIILGCDKLEKFLASFL